MGIKQVFSTIKQWIWLILLGCVIGGGVGFFVSSRQTPVYQAQARFVILPAAQTTYDYYSYLSNQDLISTYAELLTTEDLLYQASNELGFPVLKGQATASQVGDTKFVLLTVKDTDPFKAAVIANGLVEILIDQNEKLQTVQFEATEKNLQTRVEQAEEQINILEGQITQLSTEVVQKQIESVQQQLADVQAQINNLNTDIASIDPDSESLIDQEQLAAYQTKLAEIQPILNLYQEIYTQLVVLGQVPSSTQNMPNDLDRLKTTLNLYQQIYITSINNLETLKLTKAQNTPTVMQVESATKPNTPISPKPMQSTALGAAIGLLLTGAVIFLIEFLDDTLKTPDDIKDVLNVPVIGFIGELKQNPRNGREILGTYVARNPRSPVAEAFRSLRTNLEYSSVDEPVRTVLVTSSGEQEGKSTVASNLAIAQAQSGKTVVLVDADMRRPKVHTHFSRPNRTGLSDIVTGKLNIEDVIIPIENIMNLSIITCGTIPPNPAELLGSERMTKLIQEMEEKFDYVVIDTPPMIVSDPQILSTKVDGLIFVIIPGQTKALSAIRPIEELHRIDSRVLGVVANKIPRNRDYYYGGYNYYSPYSNNYTYHSEPLVPEEIEIDPEMKVIKLGTYFDKYKRKDSKS